MAEDALNPNKQWWEKGRLTVPVNNTVTMRHTSYTNGDIEIPALIIRPDDNKKYPGVLFQHGRRGLDDLAAKDAIQRAADFVRHYLQ
ncbi:MAG: hypothetical protein ABW201_07160 [Candidatus Thiodiazotropha sp.]